MNIINKNNIPGNFSNITDMIEKYIDGDLGLYKIINSSDSIYIEFPTNVKFKKTSETLSEYGLASIKNFTYNANTNFYINILNFYVLFNIVDEYDYSSELLSSLYLTSGFELLFMQLDENKISAKTFKTLRVLEDFRFSKYIYSKMNYSGLSNDWLISNLLNSITKTNNNQQIKLIVNKYNSYTLDNKTICEMFREIAKYYNDKLITKPETIDVINGDIFDKLTNQEKMDWILKFNPAINSYDINIYNMSKKLADKLDITSLYNPDISRINYINDKYKSLIDSITMNEQNCRLYKTILYLTMYLARNSKAFGDLRPVEYMNKILDRGTSWAVGSDKTHDPSFYGDSNGWKAFYGYYSYMTGKRNPYKEIIDNKQVDDMDKYGRMMHQYFKDSGMSKTLYDLIFEKGIIGDRSIYDTVSMVKELINLLEQPIVASSAINDSLNQIKGIVSSMINSVVCALDSSISDVAKKLFYVEFIPISGKKYSVSQVHNYAAFIKTILEYFEKGEAIGTINKNDFMNKVYESLGADSEKIKKVGYCSYDKTLNSTIGMELFTEYLYKYSEDDTYYAKTHAKVLYSLIQFAIQKNVNAYGKSYLTIVDYGDKAYIRKLISSLSELEIFYVMNLYNISFYDFNSNFTSFKTKELYDFNNKLNDITYIRDHDSNSDSLYKSFTSQKTEVLLLDKTNKFFNTCNYNRYIKEMTNEYFTVMDANKKNISKGIYEKNDVSDVDDFLMRFLPSFGELAKAFGYSNVSVQLLIDILDYLCNFVTDIMFKDYFLKIKLFINEKVRSFSEDMFKVLDKFEMEDTIINFDFGGSEFVKKIDEILKLLENFTLSSTVLDKCFIDAAIENVSVNDLLETDINSEFSAIVDSIGSIENDEIRNEIYDTIKNEISNGSNNGSTENKYVKVDDVTSSIFDKIIKDSISNEVKPDKIIYEDDEIYLATSDGEKTTIITSEDTINNGKINISDKSDTIFKEITLEKNIVSDVKDEISTMIEIRDFVKNITNKKIITIMNEINKNKSELDKELSKVKPNMGKIKEHIRKDVELTKTLEDVKKENGIITSGFSNLETPEYQESSVVLHDFSNGDFNISNTKDVLEELNNYAVSEKIQLTNAQITALLK